jgi:hypothetical protein
MKRGFVNIEAVDQIILKISDDATVFILMKMNKYLKSLCDENFWRSRVTVFCLYHFEKDLIQNKPKKDYMVWVLFAITSGS